MDDKPVVKPVGCTEARERAEEAARAGNWQESMAWSMLGLLIAQGKRR